MSLPVQGGRTTRLPFKIGTKLARACWYASRNTRASNRTTCEIAERRESAGSDLHSWHPQEERFGADNEKRGLRTIVGRDYSPIDLTVKCVANHLNTKSKDPTPGNRTANESGLLDHMAETRSASRVFRQIDVLDSSAGLQDAAPFSSLVNLASALLTY